MASLKMTASRVEKLRVPEGADRADFVDDQQPGLFLRVTARGRKTWSLMYRVAGAGGVSATGRPLAGKVQRMTVGTYPAKSLSDARDEARDYLKLAAKGRDPAKVLRADIFERREADANTVGAVAEDFIQRHRKRRNSAQTAAEAESTIRRLILPRWKDRPVTEIARRDVIRLLDDIEHEAEQPGATFRRGAANKALEELSGVLGWAVHRGLIEVNPARGILRPVPKLRRDRVLIATNDAGELRNCDELLRVWHAAVEIAYPFGDMYRMLILTGQRLREIAELKWDEVYGIDGDDPRIELPKDRTKSDRDHVVPLSPRAAAILHRLREQRTHGPFVFSTTHGRRPVSGFTKAKARLDEKVQKAGGALAPWRVHDLRRTAATGIAALGFPPYVVGAVLNHSPGATAGVTGAVYVQYRFGVEKRRALEAWNEYVVSLADGRASANNVVDLKVVRSAR